MNINARFTVLVALLSLSSVWGFRTSSVSQADRLRNELDSIEMLIQDHRRKGKSIEVLVRDAETLQLAIETANDRVESDPTSTLVQGSDDDLKSPIVLPSSPIDWAIIIVGAIAVIAILLLVILQIAQKVRKSRTVKPKPQTRKVDPVKYTASQSPKKLVDSENRENKAPEWVQAMRSYDQTSAPSSPFETSAPIAKEQVKVQVKPSTQQPVMPTREQEAVQRATQTQSPAPISVHQEQDKQPIRTEQPIVQQRETEIPQNIPIVPKPEIVQPVITPDPVFEDTKDLDEAISLVEKETAPAIEVKAEPSRGAVVRDQIVTLYDSGKTSIEIAKEVGMSIGEIELVLTLARRMR